MTAEQDERVQFDKTYWEDHWAPARDGHSRDLPVNPYVPAETLHLPRGTVLDAGCGMGTEALWLAEQGWQVTAADIAAPALATAAARAAAAGLDAQIEWVEADLSRWEPERSWDLVVTSYAHADNGQLAFYRRIASWVASGGSIVVVGHLHGRGHQGHEHPEDATATLTAVTDLFTGPDWRIQASYENTRTVGHGDQSTQLRDVIVRARRLT